MAEGPRLTCHVCGRPLAPPYHILGHRAYCDEHWAVVNRPHPSFWRAALTHFGLVAVLTAIVAGLAATLPPLASTALIVAGLILALMPTILWGVYFYQQDQLEPEPKTRILEVFGMGLLLAQAVGFPIIGWFRLGDWAEGDPVVSLLAAILVRGFVYSALIYYTVRVVVYATPDFDERMDGAIYGTTAGLAIATLSNLHYVLDNSGVQLGPGVIHVVTTALAQASFGGLIGYFMSEAKFQHKPFWWIPLGVSLIAIVNGFFTWVIGEVSVTGLTVDPWRSLVTGLAVALVSMGVLLVLMRRAMMMLLQETPSPSA